MIITIAQMAQEIVGDPARRSAQLKSIGISVAVAVFIIVLLVRKKR